MHVLMGFWPSIVYLVFRYLPKNVARPVQVCGTLYGHVSAVALLVCQNSHTPHLICTWRNSVRRILLVTNGPFEGPKCRQIEWCSIIAHSHIVHRFMPEAPPAYNRMPRHRITSSAVSARGNGWFCRRMQSYGEAARVLKFQADNPVRLL